MVRDVGMHWTLPKVILTTQYLNRLVHVMGRVTDAGIKSLTIVGALDSQALAAHGRRVLFPAITAVSRYLTR